MTTRQELIDGLNMVIRQGTRLMCTFEKVDWTRQVLHHDWQRQVQHSEPGWNRKQVYCHLSAICEITTRMLHGQVMSQAEISAENDRLVAERQQLSEEALMAEYKNAHEKVVQLIQIMPDQILNMPAKVGAVEGTVAEIIDSVLVLHALSHLYGAGGALAG